MSPHSTPPPSSPGILSNPREREIKTQGKNHQEPEGQPGSHIQTCGRDLQSWAGKEVRVREDEMARDRRKEGGLCQAESSPTASSILVSLPPLRHTRGQVSTVITAVKAKMCTQRGDCWNWLVTGCSWPRN